MDRGDLRESLERRARDLFALCDPRCQGFATKADLAALQGELPLPPAQLDDVFDALDANADGQLTLDEFTQGFGMFLGIDSLPSAYPEYEQVLELEDDEEMLEELLDHLGATHLFSDEDYLREMWKRVNKDDPVMRSNFENFISRMAADLKESAQEKSKLQTALSSNRKEHEVHVQSLYTEMEEQMILEKGRLVEEEQRKGQRLRDEFESELQLKDQQLKDLLDKHTKIENRLEELNSIDSAKKFENSKLQKERDGLERRLLSSEQALHDAERHLTQLRKRSLDERRGRAQMALKVSEGIALERENLALELNHLKEENQRLLDEKDELVQSTIHNQSPSNCKSSSRRQANSSKIPVPHSPDANRSENQLPFVESFKPRLSSNERTVAEIHPLMKQESQFDGCKNYGNSPPISAHRRASLQRRLSVHKSALDEAAPTRVFKVVFVGDSGVGKTSILQRFCTDTFKSTFSATIGVDFQVKTIQVDGERIALQLWDTAGQERFRSMTHQYFRKADGIIVVYDVTSETTFRNVRNWLHNIQEGAQECTMVLLLGNKVDLCQSDADRVVRIKDGAKLADEYGSIFFETSAKTGDSINQAIEALASILKTKEDETLEHVLKLQEEEKDRRRKKCC